MLTLPQSVRIWLATTPVDLRKGFDGLAALVQAEWKRDLYAGHLFVFFGKRRDALKVLFFDGSGLCLFYKRLDSGCFQVPQGLEQGATSLAVEEHVLEELLDGLRVEAPRRGPRPH